MLDVRLVSDRLDEVRAQLAGRGFEDAELLARLAELSDRRRGLITAIESQRHERKTASQAMGKIADKKSEEFTAKRQELKALGDRIQADEGVLREVEAELEELVLQLPNLPSEDAPEGLREEQNVELRQWGERPAMDFEPQDHVALGEALGILDFARAVKTSGSRFVVLRGMGARLERALIQFMLDMHVDQHGYTEVWTPALVKAAALRGTSQLPKFEADLFKIATDESFAAAQVEAGGGDASDHALYLCPTAEVPITNLHADEILEQVPVTYCGYTACFRSEAGSYGRDTRGMIRQHQFDKVELVRFVAPEDAEEEHAKLTAHAEAVLQALGLHYRVMDLCRGDMGFGAKRCFDIEVWLPGQQQYREISSCSWFGDFQARRMKCRYRPADGGKKSKPRLVHTINGSGLAIGRTLIALLENYQQADGSVLIPEALRPYVGGREVLTP